MSGFVPDSASGAALGGAVGWSMILLFNRFAPVPLLAVCSRVLPALAAVSTGALLLGLAWLLV